MKEIRNVPTIPVVSINVFSISDWVWGKCIFLTWNNSNTTKLILRLPYFLCLQLIVQILSTVKRISLCCDIM